MEISARELRGQPGRFISQAARGTEVVITIRGKKVARLVPYERKTPDSDATDDEIFGLWEDRDDIESVENHVRSLRKRRQP